MGKTVEIISLATIAGLFIFLIYQFATDFKTTLIVVLLLSLVMYVKKRFFGK